MEQKTKIKVEESKQELVITREFDLPIELLFKAFSDPNLMEQWMGTKLLKFEAKKYGGYHAETVDNIGKIIFQAHGVFHDFIPDRKITRTFEMENANIGVQLEIYEFEKLSSNTSKLNVHIIYESIAKRDQLLKFPFASGLNMAHDRLQEILTNSK